MQRYSQEQDQWHTKLNRTNLIKQNMPLPSLDKVNWWTLPWTNLPDEHLSFVFVWDLPSNHCTDHVKFDEHVQYWTMTLTCEGFNYLVFQQSYVTKGLWGFLHVTVYRMAINDSPIDSSLYLSYHGFKMIHHRFKDRSQAFLPTVGLNYNVTSKVWKLLWLSKERPVVPQ